MSLELSSLDSNERIIVHEIGISAIASVPAELNVIVILGESGLSKSFALNAICGSQAFKTGYGLDTVTKGSEVFILMPTESNKLFGLRDNVSLGFVDLEGFGADHTSDSSYHLKLIAPFVAISRILIWNILFPSAIGGRILTNG